METKLIVIFGMPGAGKTYVAQILSDTFGYVSYNGDEALPTDMKEKILNKSDVTTAMRVNFVDNMINEIKAISNENNKIVLHQALIKKHMREQLRQKFSNALFLWVTSDDAILKDRYMKRAYFNLGLEYLQVMINAFEIPTEPHIRIYNNANGPEEIIRQLRNVVV